MAPHTSYESDVYNGEIFFSHWLDLYLVRGRGEEERTAGIWRFMIGLEEQKKGYGRAALIQLLKMIRETGKFDLVYLDYAEGNTVARELYYSCGFRETGEVDDDEVIMELPLTDQPKVGMVTADEDDMDDFLELIQEE